MCSSDLVFGREEAAAAAQAVGIEDIIAKPVTESSLMDALARVLSAKAQHPRSSGWTMPPPPGATASLLAGVRVLVVDDNEVNQQIGRGLLEKVGAEVKTAANGSEAVEQVGRRPFDLVLMDMQMPVMDGITATLAIRARPELAWLPIVAMTDRKSTRLNSSH